jgi:hypothetical protein
MVAVAARLTIKRRQSANALREEPGRNSAGTVFPLAGLQGRGPDAVVPHG